MADYKSYIGVDVSKNWLDVHVNPGAEAFRVEYTSAGLDELVARLSDRSDGLVVLEATGKYEAVAAASLVSSGFKVAVVNPRQVRSFARATGRLAKTDALDAEVIALFAEALKPEVRPLRSKDEVQFNELLARRRQVIEMLVAENNRLKGVASRKVGKGIKAHITWLKGALKRADDDLSDAVKSSPVWRAKDILLRSVPGVGKVTSLALLAGLIELGDLSSKQIASLVGVAPMNRDSGRMRGKRTISGGRAAVRAALYMAALSATRCSSQLAPIYERMTKAGKPFKVVIVAIMRKLLITLNAVIARGTPWVAKMP